VSFKPGAEEASKVKWYSIEDAIELNKDEPRKIMVDVYTDWCGPCKIMDKKVFGDQRVADHLNENYYAVKLDGEYKDAIEYEGITYEFVKQGGRGYHELAAALLDGRMAYPTVVFLDEELAVINRVTGVQPTDLFNEYVQYISNNSYKTVDWFEYSNQTVSNCFRMTHIIFLG